MPNSDLIDELRLIVHPLILGEGASLFDSVCTERRFRLAESVLLGDGSVRLVFRK